MNQNNKKPLELLKLDDKNFQFIVNLVFDFVYYFNSNPAEYQTQNNRDNSLKLVLTGDIAGNIYKTVKKNPQILTMSLVGDDISKENFDEILENMKIAFIEKIKIDNPRGDYCWLVQFEGIFDAILHPAKPVNQANQPANQLKTLPKISFEIIEEKKKNQQNENQQPQSNNTANNNKKPQHKSGLKLVIESDKKYELQFLEITTATETEIPSIQVYPNIFIPNQLGANITPDDELSCAVLLKLYTHERNTRLFGLNEYKNYRKKKNIQELPQNNSGKILNSLLNSEYQKQYKLILNEGVVNNNFLLQSNNNKKTVYYNKIQALYEKCKIFYRKEHDNSFQGKQRMYGIYSKNRENIKGNEESQKEMESRLKNGIRVVKKVSSIDYVPKTVYSSKFTDKEDDKIEFSNRFSIQSYSSQIDPFIKLTSFDFLPHSYHVQDGPKSPLFLSDIEKLNTGEYFLQFPINLDNEYKVQLPFLATKLYMIIVKPAKDQQPSKNTIILYEMDVQNDSNLNRKKRILTTSPPSNGPKKEYKFYRYKVKLETVIESYISIIYKGIPYVSPVSVLVFNEVSSASA